MLKRGTLWMAALLALLCMAACLPSALAEEFAEPSTDDRWEYNDKEDRWHLDNGRIILTISPLSRRIRFI